MKKLILIIIGLCPLLFSTAKARGTLCGDVNGNGIIDIADVLDLLKYLGGNLDIDTANGDVDFRTGTTISDVWYFLNTGEKGSSSVYCNPVDEYSFTIDETDTVYLPYRTGIGENLNEVYLPIAMTYHGMGGDFYWPLLTSAPDANGTFALTQSFVLDDTSGIMTGIGGDPLGDTLILQGVNFYGTFEGNRIYFSLRYDRVAPGEGVVAVVETDRYYPLWFSVGRNVSVMDVDLFRPVIVYVDVSFPTGDCDCNGRIDIADLVCWIEHMFGFGPACEPYMQPYSIQILDVTCSGTADISDLVYLVDYMFSDGPAPCDPFAP